MFTIENDYQYVEKGNFEVAIFWDLAVWLFLSDTNVWILTAFLPRIRSQDALLGQNLHIYIMLMSIASLYFAGTTCVNSVAVLQSLYSIPRLFLSCDTLDWSDKRAAA